VGHNVGSGSPPEKEIVGSPNHPTSHVGTPSPALLKPPANDLDRPEAAVAEGPAKDVNLTGLERQQRVLSQPGVVATAILFILFSLCLVSGVTHAFAPSRFLFFKESHPGVQIVVGATGMFACIVLFLIGFAVNRLK
jgi:hypothetical protein